MYTSFTLSFNDKKIASSFQSKFQLKKEQLIKIYLTTMATIALIVTIWSFAQANKFLAIIQAIEFVFLVLNVVIIKRTTNFWNYIILLIHISNCIFAFEYIYKQYIQQNEQLKKIQETELLIGIVITIQTICALISIDKWIIQYLQQQFTLVYILFSIVDTLFIYYLVFSIFIGLFIGFYCYIFERQAKDQFISDYQQKKNQKQYQKLLNKLFPSAVLILNPNNLNNSNNTITFFNKAYSSFLQVENSTQVCSALDKLHISDKQQAKTLEIQSLGLISDPNKKYLTILEIVEGIGMKLANQHKEIHLPSCNFLDQQNKLEKHFDILIFGCKFNSQNQIVIIINDISEKLYLDRMQELDRYKDMLLATVTHDFKTPLNGMISILQTSQQCNNLQQIQQYMKIIQNNCSLLLFLVNDILDYSRIQKGKLRLVIDEFYFSEVLEQIEQLVIFQIQQKKLKLMFVNNIKNKKLLNDKNRIIQVILNMISNAIKFTFSGFVQIIAEQVGLQFIRITVKDSGVGIPSELIPKLFQIYGTYDHNNGSNKNGVGLGLTICQSLVEQIGPEQIIKLVSKVDQGSEFSFLIYSNIQINNEIQEIQFKRKGQIRQNSIFKVCSQQYIRNNVSNNNHEDNRLAILSRCSSFRLQEQFSIELSKEDLCEYKTIDINVRQFNPKLMDIIQNNKKQEFSLRNIPVSTEFQLLFPSITRILIVDDNSFNILSLKIILQQAETLVIEDAYNGQQAIDKIKLREINQQSPYDFIFMDVNMPVMDGIEAIKKIRSEFSFQKQLKIVSCTAYTEVEDIQKCKDAGADSFLGKPITRDNCYQVLFNLLK